MNWIGRERTPETMKKIEIIIKKIQLTTLNCVCVYVYISSISSTVAIWNYYNFIIPHFYPFRVFTQCLTCSLLHSPGSTIMMWINECIYLSKHEQSVRKKINFFLTTMMIINSILFALFITIFLARIWKMIRRLNLVT